jgi:capsid portal protein
MGMMPNNTGGFGDVEKAAKVFARNELVPLQKRIKNALNQWAGVPVCDFEPYSLGEDLSSKSNEAEHK